MSHALMAVRQLELLRLCKLYSQKTANDTPAKSEITESCYQMPANQQTGKIALMDSTHIPTFYSIFYLILFLISFTPKQAGQITEYLYLSLPRARKDIHYLTYVFTSSFCFKLAMIGFYFTVGRTHKAIFFNKLDN